MAMVAHVDEAPDYYHVLGLLPEATSDEVRGAYIREAIRWHPERNIDDQNATERFRLVADAYYVLSDAARRRVYDSARANDQQQIQPLQVDANGTFADVFAELLRPEVEHPSHIYGTLGAVSGAILGFITANMVGAVAGFAAGGALGKVRDAKGVSVYDAFTKLSSPQRRQILERIATQILGVAMSGTSGTINNLLM
ncbi:hypothetical protein SmJEL517_g00252 [Synchytrium microbalum]|uniref:J domain-containing protein n=1 Tax=Synchytrium microbalum TaxID=1806994 RepID=A0A507C8Q4_9FUNG|nr:uncharacterized protein SmJEL517_g00252 [Synchytrium microbalum]TPX37970.1 hypothetical protein SmJEL517_g00252 [Synchytrium microbalum]